MAAEWVAAIAAIVAAFLGALIAGGFLVGGASLTERSARRREEAQFVRERLARRRDRRADLYVDLAEHAQANRVALDEITDEYGTDRQQMDGLQQEDRLTARVRLFAPDLLDLWLGVLAAYGNVVVELYEGDGVRTDNRMWLPPRHPRAVACKGAIAALEAALQRAIESDT